MNDQEISSLLTTAQAICRECIECDGPMCYTKNPTKKCSKCHTSFYCNIACQKKDWKEHKQKCTDIKKTRKAIADLGKNADQFEERKALNMKCPRCHEEPMQARVALNDCGHAICIGCIHNWYAESQSNALDEVTLTCPICGHDSEIDIVDQIEERMFYYERLSDWFQNPISRDQRRRYGELALSENEKLLTIKISNSVACNGFFIIKARILDLMGEQQEAMHILEDHCKEEDFCDGKEDGEATNPNSLFELLMLKACIHQNLEEYDQAINIYFDKLLPTLDEQNQSDNWNIYRIYCRAARCALKLGQYETCIQRCNVVIKFHRHVDEIYESKALSLKALGNLEEAIETMNVGIIYETPGDDKNTAHLVEVYQELCNIRGEHRK
jgi:tetratricopeptide (TPR) repeat protein